MPKTRMGYERIKRMHAAGDHSRCKFGCSPENQEPNQHSEFIEGYAVASKELAHVLGPDDPRVSVANDARAYLDTNPDLPPAVLSELASITVMPEDLSGDIPDSVEIIRVRSARQLLDDARSGVFHN